MALTTDGVTQVFATNVLGHVVLLETLLRQDKLTDAALYVGSEAGRNGEIGATVRPMATEIDRVRSPAEAGQLLLPESPDSGRIRRAMYQDDSGAVTPVLFGRRKWIRPHPVQQSRYARQFPSGIDQFGAK